MPIICEKARLVFFPVPGVENSRLKLLFWLLNQPADVTARPWRVDNRRGYRAWPYKRSHEAIPDGYHSLALIKDPVNNLFDFWFGFVKPPYFRRFRDVEKLEAARLPMAPTFEQFITRFDDYRAQSSLVAYHTDPVSKYLGPDLSRFDTVFTAEQFSQACAYVQEHAKTAAEPDYPPAPPTPKRTLIDASILEKLRQITAQDYAFFDGTFKFDDSDVVQGAVSVARAAATPLPVMQRVVAQKPVRNLSVTCMLKERPELVRAFVGYYKDLGFSRIHLYFDDPSDPMISELSCDPVVAAHPMDADFWEGRVRGNALEARQKVCYRDAYESQSEGWMLFCDADEFLWPDRSMEQLLSDAPPGQRILRGQSGEPIWRADTPNTGLLSADLYRRPIYGPTWRQIGDRLYGKAKYYFKWGLLSHISGKYMVKCGLEIEKLATHRVYFADGLHNRLNPAPDEVTAKLIHYDAMSFPHWQDKLARRLVKGHSYAGQSDERIRQVKAFAKSRNKDGGEALFRSLYTLNKSSADLMHAHGLLWDLKVF